jgi:hypothetical protein
MENQRRDKNKSALGPNWQEPILVGRVGKRTGKTEEERTVWEKK